ncbi:hypothetical protein B296_00051504 [Ensete ventricosum]|uniref:Uncharacterized protein n=1 Tax=Ensete ventricosum TaxID=4639 RepID=A0A426YGG2_ENSVE|nr:hypothetical protein B296_00051504 [Ensete ventricosum]
MPLLSDKFRQSSKQGKTYSLDPLASHRTFRPTRPLVRVLIHKLPACASRSTPLPRSDQTNGTAQNRKPEKIRQALKQMREAKMRYLPGVLTTLEKILKKKDRTIYGAAPVALLPKPRRLLESYKSLETVKDDIAPPTTHSIASSRTGRLRSRDKSSTSQVVRAVRDRERWRFTDNDRRYDIERYALRHTEHMTKPTEKAITIKESTYERPYVKGIKADLWAKARGRTSSTQNLPRLLHILT